MCGLRYLKRLENRDLWEYRLNLTQVETERMVEHVWELKQIQFDYFFFDENCSYRLLELLQVARPSLRLTEQFPLTAIPTDTVKAVKEAGLVEKIDYRPSRERELLERAAGLVKRGGCSVYSTCSLEPEENDLLISVWLKTHPEFRLQSYRQSFPPTSGQDGAYAVLLVAN